MSELEQFRDHARFMADQEHAPGCEPVRSKPSKAHQFDAITATGRKWCQDTAAHDGHAWKGDSRFGSDYAIEWKCAGICGGCNPADHRALWARLAAEIDAYLPSGDEEDALFAVGADS